MDWCIHADLRTAGIRVVKKMRADYKVGFLGACCWTSASVSRRTRATTTVVADPDGKIAREYKQIARRVAVKIADMAQDHSAAFSKIVVRNT